MRLSVCLSLLSSHRRHCKLILWEPQDGHTRRGKHRISYIDNLLADTGACNTNELAKMMSDRDSWKKRVFEVKRLKRRPK